MILYRFHPETREFLSSRVAPVDPLESEIAEATVYARPGLYDTTVAPPEAGENEAAVWGGEEWSTIADHRGERWWRSYTDSYVVEALGTPEGQATRPAAPPPTQPELVAYAAAKRYEVEVGGFVSGTFGPLATDRSTQAMLGRTIQSIDLGIVSAPIRFKAPSGFFLLDRAALVAISTEVAAHVQSAFDTEATVAAAIASGTTTTTAAIDAAFA